MVVKPREDEKELSLKNFTSADVDQNFTNVKDDVTITSADVDGSYTFKSSLEPDLMLLGMNYVSNETSYNCNKRFCCIDIAQKTVIFTEKIEGYHSHHWLSINNLKYAVSD